jgi:hypothetical protein
MKRFVAILVGSPDRKIATTSLVLGFTSLVFSMMVYTNPNPPPSYIVTRDIILVILLVFIIMFMSIKYYKKDELVERFRSLLAHQSNLNHQMIHKLRDHFFSEIRLAFANKEKFRSDQIEEIRRVYFRKVCHSTLTDTREVFLEYFSARGFQIDDDFTITVKTVIDVNEAQGILNKLQGLDADILNKSGKYIVTAYRDPYTWEKKPERNEIKQIIYRVNEENTTFNAILNEDQKYFLCNDLRKLYLNDGYRNQNPNWQKCYNSVLAIPIRYRYQGNEQATILYGVLAIDSLNPRGHELFDEKTAYNILAVSADNLALMFGHLDMLQITMELLRGEAKS